MAHALQRNRSVLRKARRQATLAEAQKGISLLKKGIQRFAQHRPGAIALAGLASVLLLWRWVRVR